MTSVAYSRCCDASACSAVYTQARTNLLRPGSALTGTEIAARCTRPGWQGLVASAQDEAGFPTDRNCKAAQQALSPEPG